MRLLEMNATQAREWASKQTTVELDATIDMLAEHGKSHDDDKFMDVFGALTDELYMRFLPPRKP